MSVGLQRSSVFALKEEVTAGTLLAPTGATQFVPLRAGFEMSYEADQLDNDELLNDIGSAKSFKGKERVVGSHEAYTKSSGVVAQEPQLGILLESLMGGQSTAAAEYNTVASSTTILVKVDTGEGSTFEEGEALMVKKTSGVGYEVRNVSSISSDDLSLNFALNDAPGTGIDLGRSIMYKPGSSYPTFSAWLYNGNGYAVQAAAGCTAKEAKFEFSANEFGTCSYSYEGITYYFNPIEITAGTSYIDFTDDSGTFAAQVAVGWYRDPMELATAIKAALDAASPETYTVSYSSVTGKFTITYASPALLSLLWNSGANTANSIAAKIGFSTAADSTSATTYTSTDAQTYAAPYTPSYDDVDPIVLKDAELLIGTQLENICKCATSATITISKEIEDVDCICSETGVQEKIPTKREVTLEAEIVLDKYEVATFNHLLNNTSIQAALTCGPKSGGNWVAGKTVNFYFRNAVVTERSISGENFIVANISLKGFISATSKDFYINFI